MQTNIGFTTVSKTWADKIFFWKVANKQNMRYALYIAYDHRWQFRPSLEVRNKGRLFR